MAVIELDRQKSPKQAQREDAMRGLGFDPSISSMGALKRAFDLYFGLRAMSEEYKAELQGKLLILGAVTRIFSADAFNTSGTGSSNEKRLAFTEKGPCTVTTKVGDRDSRPIRSFLTNRITGHLGMKHCFYLARTGATVESIRKDLITELGLDKPT